MNRMKILGAICLMLGMLCPLKAQKFENSFTKTAKFNANASRKILVIDNVNGHVSVTGKRTSEVEIKVDQTITGETQGDLEEGKKDIKFMVEEKGDTVFVYIDSPYSRRERKGTNSWWHWNTPNSVDYHFKHNITINAPTDIDLYVGTINKGNVTVTGIHAQKLRAHNVNGDVMLTDITGETKATTVNGKVEVDYKETPSGNSKYSTVNGDVRVKYPKNLSATLRFKSMHGEFFTDFNVSNYLPSQVEKEKSKDGGMRLIVDKYTTVKVGKGDVSHKFETLNGDVYIIRK